MDVYVDSKIFSINTQSVSVQIRSYESPITAIINGVVTQFHNLPSGTYSVIEIDGKAYIQLQNYNLN
jgi:hypothetical protein